MGAASASRDLGPAFGSTSIFSTPVLVKRLLVLPRGSAVHPELLGLCQLHIDMWVDGKQF